MHDPLRSDPPPVEMTGIVPPEHDLRGRMLVHTLYAGPIAAGVLSISEAPSSVIAWTVCMAVLVVAPSMVLANAVRRFECWSWFFAVPWLMIVIAVLLGAATGSPDVPVPGLIGLAVFFGGWLLYLWERRWDFWTDARVEGPPVRRSVTPDWRAARLARIGASARPRTPGIVPGAVWARRRAKSG